MAEKGESKAVSYWSDAGPQTQYQVLWWQWWWYHSQGRHSTTPTCWTWVNTAA